MLEAISVDPKTIIVKADKESDILDVIDFISPKNKQRNINSFLQFASQHRIKGKEYKFNRDECYALLKPTHTS